MHYLIHFPPVRWKRPIIIFVCQLEKQTNRYSQRNDLLSNQPFPACLSKSCDSIRFTQLDKTKYHYAATTNRVYKSTERHTLTITKRSVPGLWKWVTHRNPVQTNQRPVLILAFYLAKLYVIFTVCRLIRYIFFIFFLFIDFYIRRVRKIG